jgi:O-antigen ligase
LKKRLSWQKIIWSALIVSFAVSVFSLPEISSGHARPLSTLDNPNFLSAYLLLTFFIIVAELLRQKRPFLLQGKNLGQKVFLLAAIPLQFLSIISCLSRGADLGLALGIIAFFLLFSYRRFASSKKKRILFLSATAFLVILAGFFVWQKGYIDRLGRIASQPVTRLGGRTQALSGRLEAWRAGWLAMKQRPWLGFGPENFVVAFDRFYSGSLESTSYPWYDKAHNLFLETGATTGLLGLASYLLIWIFAFAALFPLKKDPLLRIGLASAFVAYLAQDFFNIDTTVSLIYVYLWWALANFLSSSKQ